MGLNISALVSGSISSVPLVGGPLSTITGLLGDQHPADAGRLAANARAFNLAMAGNKAAYDYLRARSGLNGTVQVGQIDGFSDTPGALSGWATNSTQQDAASKLSTLTAAAAAGSGGAATAAGAKGDTLGKATDALTAPSVGGLPMWAVIFGALGAGYLLVRLARK